MKHSNVFKTFSNSMLLPSKGESNVQAFDSKEYAPTENNEYYIKEVEYLEEQLHVSRKPVERKKQETIKAPNYGAPKKIEKVFGNKLFMDTVTSTEVEDIRDVQNIENKNKIENNSHRKNNSNNNNENEFSDGQWEAHLESEKQKRYYSNTKKVNKNKNLNKFNITIMIPVNNTVQRYMGFARRKLVPTEKQLLHFYNDPINRIEDVSKEDDSSVLVIR